jgi:hypothetical protein
VAQPSYSTTGSRDPKSTSARANQKVRNWTAELSFN